LTEQARETFAGDQQIVLPLFSPRSAAILAGMGGLTAPIHVIAISPAVAEEASVFAPRSLTTADKPTAAAMVAATTRRIRSLIQG
jgi:uroporphyrinogen-III synthase